MSALTFSQILGYEPRLIVTKLKLSFQRFYVSLKKCFVKFASTVCIFCQPIVVWTQNRSGKTSGQNLFSVALNLYFRSKWITKINLEKTWYNPLLSFYFANRFFVPDLYSLNEFGMLIVVIAHCWPIFKKFPYIKPDHRDQHMLSQPHSDLTIETYEVQYLPTRVATSIIDVS